MSIYLDPASPTRPPSTNTTSPVVYDEAPVARYSTACAVSSGVAMRPSGTGGRTDFQVSLDPALPSSLVVPGHTALTRTCGASSDAKQRVAAHIAAFMTPYAPNPPIGVKSRCAHQIDDGPVTTFRHRRSKSPSEVDGSRDIGLQPRLPLLVRRLHERLVTQLHQCVVDDHIGATELLDHPVSEVIDVGRVADVAGDRDDAAAADIAERRCGFLQRTDGPGRDDQIGARLGEEPSGRRPDVARGARDQGDASVEAGAAHVSRRTARRTRR